MFGIYEQFKIEIPLFDETACFDRTIAFQAISLTAPDTRTEKLGIYYEIVFPRPSPL